MAEALATMVVVGPLLSVVMEKASSYLLYQYQVMEGVEEEHEVLKRKLLDILDVVTDAEEAANHREGPKAWLDAVRKAAYQANDLFDELKYEAFRRQAKKKGQYKHLGMDVIKLFPSHNRVAFRYRMAMKLRMVLNAFEVLTAEMDYFRFRSGLQPQISMNRWEIVPDIVEPMCNIDCRARAKEKQMLVKALLDQASNVDLTVLPIVGMGGLGKTTLAQLIYNDPVIQKHFQLLLWVCVSEDFDVDSLAKSIFEAATKEKSGSETSGASPLVDLQNVVRGKRFLLVLDDVWNHDVSKWEKLKSCLQHGGNGSSVLTTTRDQFVARIMGTTPVYRLELCDEIFIKEIIKKGAFSLQEERPELVRMIDDVAKKCVGSPLAATAMGSILRTKTTVDEWKDLLGILRLSDEVNGILPILILSYNSLPSHMKQCFAFCAIFPYDYEIDVEMLIQLWIANGFIPEQRGVCPESTAKYIFNELVSRSFFQNVKIDPFGEAPLSSMVEGSKQRSYSRMTCNIHDLMHDVALSATGNECVTIATEQSQIENYFTYYARHLFLSVEEPETILNAFLEKGSPAIQTLICEGDVKEDLQHLSKYSSLRALRFKGASIPKPMYLHHLRYLDLSDSHISALPEDISTLYHLQTLNLSGCYKLERLPKGMKYMSALRHLYTHGCWKLNSMPSGFGYLTSLQILTCFVAGAGSSCSKVGELGRLDDLGGQLELRQLENVTGEDAKAANLENKKRLNKLTLRWTDGDKEAQNSDNELLEGLEPHHELKVLRIYSYRGHTCPSWMNMLHGMVVLELYGCKWLDELPALWKLPALRVLCLHGLENIRYFCHSAFPALRELELVDLTSLERWEAGEEGTAGEEIAFYQLEKLLVRNCPEFTTLPEAPKLRVLTLEGDRQRILSLHATSRYIGSLSILKLSADDLESEAEQNSSEWLHGKEEWDHKSPLTIMGLWGCNLLFVHPSALALWNCFAQLVDLAIRKCNALVNWPEEVFQGLASLRTLSILECRNLTGHTQGASGKSVPEPSRILPRLESLEIYDCESLVKVPTNHRFLQILGSLKIWRCDGLSEVAGLPPSIETLEIRCCGNLGSLSGQLDGLKTLRIEECSKLESLESCLGRPLSLETLHLTSCSSMQSLPNEPQAYSSLRALRIESCPALKSLPETLQQRLDHLEEICLDALHEEPKAWKYAVSGMSCFK